MTQSEKVYYPALTGFRAVAAYLVFFHHANPFSKDGWSGFLHSFTHEFHVGVSLFFVLSGFLIYSRYANEIQKSNKWFRHYIQNRFARIYPLYFILTTLTFLVFFIQGQSVDGFSYFMNITFLKGFFDDLKFSGIAQGWSLTTEECFYVLAPFIFILMRRFRLLYLWLVSLSIGTILVLLFKGVNFLGFFEDFTFLFNYTFFGRCFEFLTGVWVAHYLNSIREFKKINYTYSGLLLFLLIVALLTRFNADGGTELDGLVGITLNNFILPISVGMIIVGLIKEETLVQQMLSSSFFQLLGKSSYAFYLVHAGIFFSYGYHHITENIFVLFILLNGLAIVLYYFVEMPLNKSGEQKRV